MKKRVKTGLLIALFLAIFLLMSSGVNAGCPNNIKIKSDGTISPDEAQDLFEENENIYSLKESLTNCKYSGIIIEKSNIILDCQGFFIDGDKSGHDAGIRIRADGVTIKNCEIKEFSDNGGIVAYKKGIPFPISNPFLILNKIHNNKGPGIYITGSDQNSDPANRAYVRNNRIYSNSKNGIYINARNAYVGYNTILNNEENGIRIANNNYVSSIAIMKNHINGHAGDFYDINSPTGLTYGSQAFPQACNRVKVGTYIKTTAPNNYCNKNPVSGTDCTIGNKCSFLAPSEKLDNYNGELTNLFFPFCNALSLIKEYFPEHSCLDKSQGDTFCVSGETDKVYDCSGCGGWHYSDCSVNSHCVENHNRGVCCIDDFLDGCEYAEDCCDNSLTCQEGKCCLADDNICEVNEQCCPGRMCVDGVCKIPPCEISNAKITPVENCGEPVGTPAKCDVGDEIKLEAQYHATCDANYLEIKVEDNEDQTCKFNMYVYCDIGQANCEGNWLISNVPENCRGKTVLAKKATLYDEDENEIKSSTDVSGGFKFDENALTLSHVDLWPEDKTIGKDKTITYHLDAFYKDINGQIVFPPKDVSVTSWTNYTSDNGEVARPQTEINIFKGVGEGTVTIDAAFPVELASNGWTKYDSTGLSVKETNCELISVEIDDEKCGTNGCEKNEKIDIAFEMKTSCENPRIINIDARDNKECKIKISKTFNPSQECQVSGNMFCNIEWQILDVPEKCIGSTVNGYFAELNKSDGEWLASLQGELGEIKFWTENIPPVAVIAKPGFGQGQQQIDHTPLYHVNEPIEFMDNSYDTDGTITKWRWFIKYKDEPYEKIKEFSQKETFYETFTLGGSYKVKLEVTDDTNEQGIDEKWFYVTDGENPAIAFSSPDEDEIQDRTIFFNASGSVDYPSGTKEGLDKFSWQLGDDSVPNIFEGNYEEASKFTHVVAKAKEEYQFNLTLYDEEGNFDFKYLIFKTWHCYDDGTNKWVFADSQSASCLSSKPDYCTNIGGDQETGVGNIIPKASICSCPSGQTPIGDNCEAGYVPECTATNAGACSEINGCWWDECVACTVNPPNSCSSYKDKFNCDKDNCATGYNPTSQGACGDIVNIGGEYYYVDCKGCDWDENDNVCIQDYELEEQNGQGTMECHESRVYGNCDGGFQDVTITTECCGAVDKGLGSCGFTGQPYKYSEDIITETQLCGIAARPLPGFSWLNSLAVIFIIAVYYIFTLLRMKKKRK